MKIFVISDTHGNLDKVYRVYKKLKDIDLIIHCGDLYTDAIELQEKLACPVVWVKGNVDGSFDEKDYSIVETECGNILVTHGHMQNVGYSEQRLLYLTEELDCIAAVYGHTHIPAYTEFDGIYLMNPGSLSRPRDGSNGSYGIINTDDYSFSGSIVYYDRVINADSDNGKGGNSGEKPKVRGGYLKGLLNYSDRF